jgi:hypothetical protein
MGSLAAMEAGAALKMAVARETYELEYVTGATHVLSLAEADILCTGGSLVASTLVGALADLPTALPALLTEAGLNAVRRL